jgi:hypothetical protein
MFVFFNLKGGNHEAPIEPRPSAARSRTRDGLRRQGPGPAEDLPRPPSHENLVRRGDAPETDGQGDQMSLLKKFYNGAPRVKIKTKI